MANQQPPPAPQPLDYNKILTDANTGTDKLSTTVANSNVAGMQIGNSAFANYLTSDGRSLTLDPARKKELDKSIKTDTGKLNKANKGVTTTTGKLTTAQKKLDAAKLNPKTSPKTLKSLEGTVNKLKGTLDSFTSQITSYTTSIDTSKKALTTEGPSITETYKAADSQSYEAIDAATEYANFLGKITSQGQTYLDTLAKGYTANEIKANPITESKIGNVANVNVAQVGRGQLGQSLYQSAQDRIALNGQLSAEASRDAVQASREGFAARGMATGNSALAGELLNRDRYSQQRFLQDAGFAQSVQNSDVARQQNNSGVSLEADKLNQVKELQLGTSNAQLAQQAAVSNQQNRFVSQTSNEEARRVGSQLNTGMAGSASDFVNNQNQLGMSTKLGMANVYSASNPLFRNLGIGTTFANSGTGSQTMGPSLELAGNTASFNTNMAASNYNSYMNNNSALQGAYMQAGASKAAGNSAMTGSIIGGAGAAVGGAAMAAACCWIARAAFGTATSRWMLYRRAMLRGASDRTIRLYCTHGPAIANYITTSLRRRIARIILCTLELAWK